MQGATEVAAGQLFQRVGDDERVGTPGPGDDDSQLIGELDAEQFGSRVGGHVRVVAVGPVGVVDLDIEVDEGVTITLAVALDSRDDAIRNALAAVGLLEGQRRRLPEAVVLEPGERPGGRLGGRPVDDAGLDTAFFGPDSEVGVGRRDHGVAGREKDHVGRLGGLENRFGLALDTGAVANLDVGSVERFEPVEVSSDEAAGVEFGEDAVRVADSVASLDGDRAFVVEAKADECEHTRSQSAPGIKGAKRQAYRRRRESERMGVPCVRVPVTDGEATRQRLAETDAIDDGYDITAEDGVLYVPVTDPAEVPDTFEVVEFDAPVREGQTMPADELGFAPSYERLGDLVIIDEDDPERARAIADAIMASDLPVEGVLNRASKIKGTERVRDWAVLAGDTTEVLHREYGCSFELDLAEVYFSPRLATERHRVVEQVSEGERAFDMFAGVGPFVVPFAKRGATCVGTDINERAVEYLRANVERNGVPDRVTAICGDVREVASDYEGWADRIVMNLPHSAGEFLETAVELAGDDCTIHYYDIQPDTDPFGPGERAIRAAAEPEYAVSIETHRTVRSYAPGEHNVVVDARLRR